MATITTADIDNDFVSSAAPTEDLKREGATLTEEEKAAKYPKMLIGSGLDDLTVKEREKQRLDLH